MDLSKTNIPIDPDLGLSVTQSLSRALQVCGVSRGLASKVEDEFWLQMQAAYPETPKEPK